MTFVAPVLAAFCVAAAAHAAPPACPTSTPQPGPGLVDPFRGRDPKAVAADTEAFKLEAAEKWTEARDRYREALSADPHDLSAQHGILRVLIRLKCLDDARTEALAFIRQAYVPDWFFLQGAEDLREARDQIDPKEAAAAARERTLQHWRRIRQTFAAA